MLLKVKHAELNEVRNVIKTDSSVLDDEITSLLDSVANLKTIWQGQDSDIFCDNVTEYFNKMRQITSTMNNISDFMGKVNNNYVENSEVFCRELKREVDNYDE